ncbi:peptidylprolyl isomerase [candidate division WOR-3 bacterium]|nr:peptidylprolyl isomerase [candidate division WOR-3 bacterium]
MIQRLRKQITVFLWFAVAIFVAFIFFQWGMRFASSRSMTQLQKGVIAEVNGKEISSIAYSNLVRNYMEMGYTEDEASDSAFNTLVEATILRDYYQKVGLIPSDKEVVDAIKTNPPPQILQDTTFYTSGEFDYLKYAELFQNPQNIRYFRQYESWIRDIIPRQRLYMQVLSTVQPTASINEYFKRNTLFTVEYGEIHTEDIIVDFDESDLQEYYEREKELFKRPKAILVQYVKFNLSASLEDENMLIEEATDIISQLHSGESFDTLVLRFSDDSKTKREFGYIGFVKRGKLSNKLEKAIFSMSRDDIYGPIKTEDGVYIFKCYSRTRDSVEISQIYLRLVPSYETIGLAMDNAFSFIELAQENGFENGAQAMNLELQETTSEELDGFDISNLLLTSKIGKISQPIRRKDGIYVWTNRGTIPETIPPFSEIKEEVKESYLKEKREAIIKTILIEVKNNVEYGTTFNRALKDIKYKKVDKFSIVNPPIDMPTDPTFYGAIWVTSEGNVSNPVIGKDACFIIKCIKREEPEIETIQEKFSEFQVELWKERRDKAFNEWLKSQIELSKIEDYRY